MSWTDPKGTVTLVRAVELMEFKTHAHVYFDVHLIMAKNLGLGDDRLLNPSHA